MPVKLNIGLSRKVGEANFGSRGASINLEVELDIGTLNDADQLRERVRDLYELARQSVDDELHRAADDRNPATRADELSANRLHGHSGNGHVANSAPRNGHAVNGHAVNGHAVNGHPVNGQTSGISNGRANGQSHSPRTVEVARASQSQIRAIYAITKRLGLDPHAIILEKFRIYRIEDLTMREASGLIDDLKSLQTEVRA